MLTSVNINLITCSDQFKGWNHFLNIISEPTSFSDAMRYFIRGGSRVFSGKADFQKSFENFVNLFFSSTLIF